MLMSTALSHYIVRDFAMERKEVFCICRKTRKIQVILHDKASFADANDQFLTVTFHRSCQREQGCVFTPSSVVPSYWAPSKPFFTLKTKAAYIFEILYQPTEHTVPQSKISVGIYPKKDGRNTPYFLDTSTLILPIP